MLIPGYLLTSLVCDPYYRIGINAANKNVVFINVMSSKRILI